MNQSKISISELYKSFNGFPVLAGVSLDVAPGESMVVIGGSGSGKSVLMKCLLGLHKPDSGLIKMGSKSIVGESDREQQRRLQKIGMVFQGSALFDSLPVWENVAFRLIQTESMDKNKAKHIALEKLSAVGLSADVGELFPSELSGGMQRRVALARAIVGQPEILFFDEPTAGLDPIISGVINSLIRQCVNDLGATAITITHDMNSARFIGDRIAMLYDGKIIWCGKTKEIDKTDNPYVQQFITGQIKGPIQLEIKGT